MRAPRALPLPACAAVLLAGGLAWAKVGLSTRFVSVSIDGLEPGRSHGLSDFSELAFPLSNPGSEPVVVALSPHRPEGPGARPPYEPIPDPAWIRFKPSVLRIEPGETASSEVIVDLPPDPRLSARHFEVALWARTLSTATVAAGVRGRLRFSVGPPPRPGRIEQPDPSCAFGPEDALLRNVGRGRRQVVRFRVENRGSKPFDLAPRALPWPSDSGTSPRGYRADASTWAEFKPARLRLPPGGAADLEVGVLAPPDFPGQGASLVVRLEAREGSPCRSRRVFVEFQQGASP